MLPKPSQKPSRTPLQNGTRKKNRFFLIFFNFWRARGLPKSSQNREKSKKKLKKSKLKNHMFFNSVFFEFSPFWPPKTKPKSRFFCYFFEGVDFMKIVLPSRRNCYFSRFEPPKNDKKSMPTSTSKKTSKKILKNLFSPPSWPPQTSQNP